MAKGDGEVQFDNREIQRILNSPELAAEVRRVCNVIMARARVLSPVKSGKYVNAFRVEIIHKRKIRVVGFVVNDDPKSGVIEATRGVLTRARRARG